MKIPTETEESRITEAYARRKKAVPVGRYSYFNPGNLLIEQELERHLLSSLSNRGYTSLRDKRVLEVGCGSGCWLRNFIRWGAQPDNIFGLDLLQERILEARRLLPKSVTLMEGSATKLDFPDQTFDLILQFTVFSSILEGTVKQTIAKEMLRVLKRDGCIIWYDFFVDNPYNPDVLSLSRQEIRCLFSDCQTQFRRVTLAPPVARIVGRVSPALCHLLSNLKLFSTHYLVFIVRIPHG